MTAPDQPRSADDAAFEADVFARACASRPVLQTITGRWGGLTLAALGESPYRFSALRRRVDGVSERMLSQTLQELERDGFVHREVQETIPPKVEYSLTPLGQRVAARLTDLIELVESEMPAVRVAQNAYDRR
ncbi:helix-turn-helix transcriptional regulator [Rhodococcus spelaei]|uniref:Helix-turn-helix transcriptional regulator n=1 Tax=Rhodococcus spelaei TaxID=2546320 RepID=A0A541BB07_9NOCA|nr:helix-turn-helix domain-containing protein [Rhodococcus spelaei]TQF69418.1 helix-turn-helix transcriptional regulator [Rhodococcus spelaei]